MSGDWFDAGNWSSDPLLPTLADDVVIDRPGFDVTVSIFDLAAEANSVSIAAGECLRIARGTLTTSGTNQLDGSLQVSGSSAGDAAELVGGDWRGGGQVSFSFQGLDLELRDLTWGLPNVVVPASSELRMHGVVTLVDDAVVQANANGSGINIDGRIDGEGTFGVGETLTSGADTATIGSDVRVDLFDGGRISGAMFINEGTVVVPSSNTQNAFVNSTTFGNEGEFRVGTGSPLVVTGAFNNEGLLRLSENARLELGQNAVFDNSAGTLELGFGSIIDTGAADPGTGPIIQGGSLLGPIARGGTMPIVGNVKNNTGANAVMIMRQILAGGIEIRSADRGSQVLLQQVAFSSTRGTLLSADNRRNTGTERGLIAISNTISDRGGAPGPDTVVVDGLVTIRGTGTPPTLGDGSIAPYSRFVQIPATDTLQLGPDVQVITDGGPIRVGTDEGELILDGSATPSADLEIELVGTAVTISPTGTFDVSAANSAISVLGASAGTASLTSEGTTTLGGGVLDVNGALSFGPGARFAIDDATAFAPMQAESATLGGTVTIAQPITGFLSVPLVVATAGLSGSAEVLASVPTGFVAEVRVSVNAATLTARCRADTNADGSLTPADFTAWINAFNNNLPGCDQNGDGSCAATDFTAWIANYNAGC